MNLVSSLGVASPTFAKGIKASSSLFFLLTELQEKRGCWWQQKSSNTGPVGMGHKDLLAAWGKLWFSIPGSGLLVSQ